jgi:hypothetical protein
VGADIEAEDDAEEAEHENANPTAGVKTADRSQSKHKAEEKEESDGDDAEWDKHECTSKQTRAASGVEGGGVGGVCETLALAWECGRLARNLAVEPSQASAQPDTSVQNAQPHEVWCPNVSGKPRFVLTLSVLLCVLVAIGHT